MRLTSSSDFPPDDPGPSVARRGPSRYRRRRRRAWRLLETCSRAMQRVTEMRTLSSDARRGRSRRRRAARGIVTRPLWHQRGHSHRRE